MADNKQLISTISKLEKELAVYREAELYRQQVLSLCDSVKKKHSKFQTSKVSGKKHFVFGFTDWHIGSRSNPDELYGLPEWDTDKAEKSLISIFSQMEEAVKRYKKVEIEGATILFLGDILHGPTGKTQRGTELDADILRESQFEKGFELASSILESSKKLFPRVNVHAVKGNHDGLHLYTMAHSLKSKFDSPKFQINIYKSKSALIKIFNTLILIDHGASDSIRSGDTPKSGTPLEAWTLSMLMRNPELLNNTNQKLLIRGHYHSFDHTEFNDFESLTLGALKGKCLFDDHRNYNSRPRQNLLVLDENGLNSVYHFYA